MNYFAPANNTSQFTSENRRAENPYSDRDSRFRGSPRDRYRDRRGGSGRGGQNFRKVEGQLLPPIDNILYHDADTKDPATIDYSFYDMPIQVHHARDQEDVRPYKEFSEFLTDLPQFLQNNIKRMKYQKLTPIQQYAIPLGRLGHDILATSQTGSGKSAAFLIPCYLNIIQNNLKELTNSPTNYNSYQRSVAQPFVIIMSPTRELALQNANASWQLSNNSGILTRVCYGGESQRAQSQILQQGCDILIATPGRLKDFLMQGIIDCRYVKYFILDEADVMLDFGFFDDIKEIRQIIMNHQQNMTPEQKEKIGRLQTSLFSATFPKEIQQIANQFLVKYYHIQIGEIGVTGKNITQILLKTQKINKLDFIKYLAAKQGQMLIFCKTKAGVDNLAQFLKQAFYHKSVDQVNDEIKNQIDQMFEYLKKQVEQSTPATSTTQYFQDINTYLDPNLIGGIHGDLTQAERTQNLNNFRSQKLKILIATDVAQRGLDLPKVEYVINYDMPMNIEDYCHRIGRTGRAGRRGCSITLVTEDESRGIMKALLNKLQECDQLVPAWYDEMLRTKWLYDKPERRRGSRGDRGGYGGRDYNQRGGGYGREREGFGDRTW